MAKRKSRTNARSRKSRRIAKETPLADNAVEHVEELHPSLAEHLPVETLSEIFLYNIPTSYSPFEKNSTLKQWRAFLSDVFPMNLTRICRSWRHAAFNNRILWSTWFVELNGPSKRAILMLRCFLEHFIGRSHGFMLRFHIRFMGTFDSVEACKSVGPLLEHQDRWEEAECHFGEQPGDVLGLTLDFDKLYLLQKLRVKGSTWDCVGVDPGVFKPNVPRYEGIPKLISLRSVEVLNLQCTTYFSILFTSPNLTELVINVHDEITVRKRIFLPTLRKLEVQNSPTLFRENGNHVTLLQVLQCKALEELNIDNLPHPHFVDVYGFVTRCDLANTLLSMRLQFADDYQPVRAEQVLIGALLSYLNALRSLTVHGELSDVLVVFLGRDGEDPDLDMSRCPQLEKLVLEKMASVDLHYTTLVTGRWNAPGRCIKSMSFVDCKNILLQEVPGGSSAHIKESKHVFKRV